MKSKRPPRKPEQPASRPTSKIPQLLAELEELCKHIGVRLTYEAIGGELGSGGLCKVKGQWRAILDKRTTPSERVALLLPLIARFPLEGVPLSAEMRELLTAVGPAKAPPPVVADAP